MLKQITAVGFILGIMSAHVLAAEAYTPPPVPAVDAGNVRYIANQPKPGYVTAWTISTGQKIWEKKLYSTAEMDNPTADNHSVYITKMTLDRDTLKIETEKNQQFTINVKEPNTSSVSLFWQTYQRLLEVVLILIGSAIIGVTVYFGRLRSYQHLSRKVAPKD